MRSIANDGSTCMTRHGTVAWFDERKGFGFIADDQGGDVFVHYEDILRPGFRTLAPGERVSFEIKPGEGGPKAACVIPAEAADRP